MTAMEPDPAGPPNDRRARAVRPKDAATLILIRHTGRGPAVLMGCRAAGHSFMPNKYVFPGGKVDRADTHVPVAGALGATDCALLDQGRHRRQPHAFGLAAIRETWEETGLLVGRPGTCKHRSSHPGWASYLASGTVPDLSGFSYVCRAITPPARHKRFDARFLMADAGTVLRDDRPPVDGAEMHDLRWFGLDEAIGLDLPNVTRFVLGEIKARLEAPDRLHQPPFLRWARGGHQMDRIGLTS